MEGLFNEWYKDFSDYASLFDDDEVYRTLTSLLQSSQNTFAFNKKLMEKAIDISWVEAIENGLIHVDNFLRNPRRTIEDVEEIVPIALSRKITVESVKHLAQHTDLIQSIDKKSGKITPSKILNVHKEESLLTYENKFVNTLIDRLYIFINTRYEKLAQVARDEEVFSLGYDTAIDNGNGGRMKVELKIETVDSLDTYDANGFTVWQRVERLKKAIEGYKGSEMCVALGKNFIRPPVMRTNAIMKNVDLKACLTLWQYIESYDKVGYEINVQNTAFKPQEGYVSDFYKIMVLNLLLFRFYMRAENDEKLTALKTQTAKTQAPKYLKKFDKYLAADYDVNAEATAGYISADADMKLEKKLPADLNLIYDQVRQVIEIESAYVEEAEEKRKEAERLRMEEEARLREQERIEEERQAELERIRQKQEEDRRIAEEMLAKKRAEMEAAERERERLEQERLARLEELRKQEEEARRKREEQERIDAERERIRQNKQMAMSELGEAEGMDAEQLTVKEPDEQELEQQAYAAVTEEEIEAAKESIEAAPENSEERFEDPRAIAARMKLEQQKREKDRAEAERAQRLKAERMHFESKPFKEIYREYSWNPIWLLSRVIRYLLAVWFNLIPEDTDHPFYKHLREERLAKKEEKQREKQIRKEMEVYYRKYAMSAKYEIRRLIADIKFKRKKKKEAKNKPRPVYNPPKRTPEQEQEIAAQMKALYRTYHVGKIELLRRAIETRRTEKKELNDSIRVKKPDATAAGTEDAPQQSSRISRIFNAALVILLIVLTVFVIYVMVCSARGKAVKVFGKSVLRVETGSMEPSIHTGDYILIETVKPETLQTGDIISFYSEDSETYDLLITHRIAEINADGTFLTRGDANPVSDRVAVRQERIAGKYTGKARFFMWISSFANLRKILLLAVMILMSLFAAYEVRTIFKIGAQAAAKKNNDDGLTPEERKEAQIRKAIEAEKRRLEEIGWQPEEDEVKSHESGKDHEKEND